MCLKDIFFLFTIFIDNKRIISFETGQQLSVVNILMSFYIYINAELSYMILPASDRW